MRIQQVEIVFHKTGTDTEPIPYFKLKLEDVLISSIAPVLGVSIESADREKVSLSYAKITWTFSDVDPKGGTGSVVTQWNLETNTEN